MIGMILIFFLSSKLLLKENKVKTVDEIKKDEGLLLLEDFEVIHTSFSH